MRLSVLALGSKHSEDPATRAAVSVPRPGSRFLSIGLTRRLHFTPWFLIVGLLAGEGVGFYSLVKTVWRR